MGRTNVDSCIFYQQNRKSREGAKKHAIHVLNNVTNFPNTVTG